MKKLILLVSATLLSAGAFAQSTPVSAQSEVNAISTHDTVSRKPHHKHRKHHVRHVVRR